MTITIDHPRPDTVDPRTGTVLFTRQERFGLTTLLQKRVREMGSTGSKLSWGRILGKATALGLSEATVTRYCGYERVNRRTLVRLASLFGFESPEEMINEARKIADEQFAGNHHDKATGGQLRLFGEDN